MFYKKNSHFSKSSLPLILLFIITVGTYYNSIVYGDFIELDDMTLMNRLLNDPPLVLKDLFLPNGTVKYFRPIIELSYRLDHFLWFDIPFGYHLTNVTFHALNAYFVYFIALLLFSGFVKGGETAAFVSAVLFAVNPLTTESVCWVSGRSDIIAAFFMLSSFLFYLLFRKKAAWIFLLPSGLLYMLAAMTKEVALALPVLVVAIEFLYHNRFSEKHDWKISSLVSCFFVILTTLYFFSFRNGGIDVTGTNTDVIIASNGVGSSSHFLNLQLIFASIGFYFKKLLFPFPLNFAIHSINLPIYGLIGVVVIVACLIWGIWLRNNISFFIAWILVTISPAVGAAVLKLPWVFWAERYLYVPLIGFSMAAGLVFVMLKKRYRNTAIIGFSLIVCIFWISTLHRIYLWADEVRLWQDTARKTDYGPVYYFYGKALLNEGREAEGVVQMEKAISKGFSYFPYLTLASIKLSNKDYDGFEQIYNAAINEFPKRPELHKYLAEKYLFILTDEKNKTQTYYLKAIDEYKKYLALQKDDLMANFKVAQLYRSVNQNKQAIPFLKRVIEIEPNSRYAATALRLLKEEIKEN